MTDPLSKLPLFATDDEIAIAIVGKKRASEWKRGALRILEARGFPRFDALHGGRPVPTIRKWYEKYMGFDHVHVQHHVEKENPESWRKSKRDRRDDRKPKLGLTYRCRDALVYLVATLIVELI